ARVATAWLRVIRNASVSARGNAAASTWECCSRGIESIGHLGMRQEWKCRTKMHPAKRDTVAKLPKTIDIRRMGGARPTSAITTSVIGTFETCPPILRMSVHRVDRKLPWSGRTDATDAY